MSFHGRANSSISIQILINAKMRWHYSFEQYINVVFLEHYIVQVHTVLQNKLKKGEQCLSQFDKIAWLLH